jgi:hypothetical protein
MPPDFKSAIEKPDQRTARAGIRRARRRRSLRLSQHRGHDRLVAAADLLSGRPFVSAPRKAAKAASSAALGFSYSGDTRLLSSCIIGEPGLDVRSWRSVVAFSLGVWSWGSVLAFGLHPSLDPVTGSPANTAAQADCDRLCAANCVLFSSGAFGYIRHSYSVIGGNVSLTRSGRSTRRRRHTPKAQPMPAPTTRSATADDTFFTALENGHPVRAACTAAGHARRCVYRWRRNDPDFGARWSCALTKAGDLLEEEADRRGRDGVDVPVFLSARNQAQIFRRPAARAPKGDPAGTLSREDHNPRPAEPASDRRAPRLLARGCGTPLRARRTRGPRHRPAADSRDFRACGRRKPDTRSATDFHPRPLCHMCHVRRAVACGKDDHNAMTSLQTAERQGVTIPLSQPRNRYSSGPIQ